MTSLTLDLPPDLYERLRAEADRLGKPAQVVAQEWLAERLPPAAPASDRERVRAALRAAGLLVEDPLGPELRKLAESSTATLDEVRSALARAGGKPLSELILEMRGPKE